MRIDQTIGALNAYRNLLQTSGGMATSLEQLSSGLRIDRAAAAAGLARCESLRAQISGATRGVRNAQDSISLVQAAEGALNEVHSILQRMRELAVSVANSTSDGTAEATEVARLRDELNAIGTRTTFAGAAVLSANAQTVDVGAGSNAANNAMQTTVGTLSSTTLAVNAFTLDGVPDAQAAIATIDTAIGTVSTKRSELGATQNRLESAACDLSVAAENLSAAESRIRHAGMGEEMVAFTRNQVLAPAPAAKLAQASQSPHVVLSLLR